jgi:hypothetical protein
MRSLCLQLGRLAVCSRAKTRRQSRSLKSDWLSRWRRVLRCRRRGGVLGAQFPKRLPKRAHLFEPVLFPLCGAGAHLLYAGRAQRLGCGVRLGARRFSQRAQLTQRQSETCTTLDWPDTGRAWWAADGAWSACGRVERAAVRQRCPPAGRGHALAKGSNNTHPHTQ